MLVDTLTVPPEVGTLLMDNPVSVIVTALLFPMLPLLLDRTTDVCAGAPEVQEALEDRTVGVGLVAKKPEG